MKAFKAGEKARIVDIPAKGSNLIGEVVTVLPIGGFGCEDDDVIVVTEWGRILMLKEHQITMSRDG